MLLKKLVPFLLKKNIFIALCSIAFYYAGNSLIQNASLGIKLNIITSMLFFSTLFIYRISNLFVQNKTVKDNNKSPALHIYDIKIELFLYIIIIVAHMAYMPHKEILFLLHLAFISVLYNFPYSRLKIRARQLPYIKIFLISYVWASISIIYPWVQSHGFTIPPKHVLFLFLAHLLFIYSITIPFDIRDYENDRKKYLRTIPHLLGIYWAKISAILAICAFAIIIISILGTNLWIMAFVGLTASLIYFCDDNKPYYYFLGYLDGTIILYCTIIYISL